MSKRKRLFLILGFLLYEVFVWAGSLLFLGDSALLVGFVLTVCGLTVLLVYLLVAKLSAAQSPPPAAPAAQGEPAPPPPQAQSPGGKPGAGAPVELIQDANEQLSKSPTLANQRVKSTISDFPVYFLFGPGGSGKTSFFLASEFQPELLAGQVHRDSAVVPTRVGNIWFVDNAVVVEAAGDVFSGDASRWSDFIASFHQPAGNSTFAKIFGGRAPSRLGGVILCCDAGSFVGVPDSTKLAAMTRLMQQRLRTVGEAFGQDFPVYVVFTKSDSIPYFSDYFSRLTQTEDRQVLGCAFPDSAPTAEGKDVVSGGLNRLYLSLAEKRLEFLQREKETTKRPGIYEFPREFKRLRSTLVQLLADVFRTNPLQPNPRLAGLYFAGTRKVAAQPTDLDRSVVQRVGDVTRIFRADDLQRLRSQAPDPQQREPEITRWSFVADLWQQILKRRPAGMAPRVSQKQSFYRRTAFLSVAGASAVAALLFFYSFVWNYGFVTDVKAASLETKAVRAGDVPSHADLQAIQRLQGTVQTLDDNSPGIFRHFLYYKGGALRQRVWPLYYERFREYFLNPVIQKLEVQISSLPGGQSSSDYRSIYSGLQTYRTITTSSQEASCKVESTLPDRLLAVWKEGRPADADAENVAKANFKFFADSLAANRIPHDLPMASQNDPKVQTARSYLMTFKGAAPLYERILEQANHEVPSAKLSELTHNTAYRGVMKVQDEVGGAYTKAGWDRVQQLIDSEASGSSDSCVLGKGNGAAMGFLPGADIKAQIKQLYIQDYIRAWREFVAGAKVLPYAGCKDASDKLESLKDNSSPLLAALLMLSDNTTFPAPQGGIAQVAAKAADNAKKGVKWPFSAVKGDPKIPGAKALNDALGGGMNEGNITSLFQPAHAVFETSPPNKEHWADGRNTPYLEALGELRMALDSLKRDDRCDDSNAAAHAQAVTALNKAQGALDALTRKFDNSDSYPAVKAFLESPLQGASALLVSSAPGETQKRTINGALSQMCSAYSKLQSKFPFSTQGDDASLDQVRKVFDPEAGLLGALHQALGEIVVRSGRSWVQKPDAPIKVAAGGLDFLNHAYQISDVLFPAPVKYQISVQGSPAIKDVTGTVDGVQFSMSAREYSWPGGGGGINLRVLPAAGGNNPLRSYTGAWGLFRLFAGADHHSPDSNQFQFTNVQADRGSSPQSILPDGTPIVLVVTQFPNGVTSAFDKKFFVMSCPAKLVE